MKTKSVKKNALFLIKKPCKYRVTYINFYVQEFYWGGFQDQHLQERKRRPGQREELKIHAVPAKM